MNYYIVRDMFPNGSITIMCRKCWLEASLTNTHSDRFETLEEAIESKRGLLNTGVNGDDGGHCPHCEVV